MTDSYQKWRDFYVGKVRSWMSPDEIRAECGKLQTADATSPEVLLIHAMHLLERYEQRNEAMRAEVDALRLASIQPELVAVALATCDAVDDLIEKWYATRESGSLPNQVVRAMGASKLLRAIAQETRND